MAGLISPTASTRKTKFTNKSSFQKKAKTPCSETLVLNVFEDPLEAVSQELFFNTLG